mmetsp:Transcript_546/g.653  ORF Transcript_546/g.653 Transcript_546/m.653 type:complete len:361 (-) Transcript_546:102-1184(-)
MILQLVTGIAMTASMAAATNSSSNGSVRSSWYHTISKQSHRVLNEEQDHISCDIQNNFFHRLEEGESEPWWFLYTDTFYKDFSPYVEEESDGRHIDHTALMEHFRATCEISENGVVHAISGIQTCTDDNDRDVTYSDIKLPVCVSNKCDIDVNTLKDSSILNYCSNGASSSREFQYQIEEIDSLIEKECKNELKSFNIDIGFGLPDFLWAMVDLRDFCVEDDDGETCDFNTAVSAFEADCEDQGGILYTYSDFWVDKKSNYTSFYRNQPLCIGKSCDVTNYFENFIFAHNKFDLSGTFYETSDDGTVDIATYEYEWISYSDSGEAKSTKRGDSKITSSAAMLSNATNRAVFVLLLGLLYL